MHLAHYKDILIFVSNDLLNLAVNIPACCRFNLQVYICVQSIAKSSLILVPLYFIGVLFIVDIFLSTKVVCF